MSNAPSPAVGTSLGSRADRLFPADPGTRKVARDLYDAVKDLAIVSPHGHVEAAVLANDEPFPDPAQLLIVPDHYVTRLVHSQGIAPSALGVPPLDGTEYERDGRIIWRTLASVWHAFRATPSRLWFEQILIDVFGIETPFGPATADAIYDELADRLAQPQYRPRALFERFGIEVLTTTDSPLATLDAHAALAADGWGSRVIPAFRPDPVVDPEIAGWADRVARLGEITAFDTSTYSGYLAALRQRRADFIQAGATSTDHGHPTARTLDLPVDEAAQLFQLLLRKGGSVEQAEAFRANMLMEFAKMSIDDGLVMQIHPGAVRNHNRWLHERFGPDRGGDIPQPTDYVAALTPLLDRYGNDGRLRLVLFTLDESAFSRELAPLAGGYPALYLGAPWWFLDSPEGMRRFRELTVETAGFYNTVGFTDDTRAFCSIPVRHDVARRVDAGFLARLVVEHRLALDEAIETLNDLTYRLPKQIYRLEHGR